MSLGLRQFSRQMATDTTTEDGYYDHRAPDVSFACLERVQGSHAVGIQIIVHSHLSSNMDVINSQALANERMGSTRAGRTPKLKDSCDTCAASKIRCNRRKPVCERCANQGYSCQYSPAQRIGRRRSAKAYVPEGTATSSPTVSSPFFRRQTLNTIITLDTSVEIHSNSQKVSSPALIPPYQHHISNRRAAATQASSCQGQTAERSEF